MAYTLRNVSRLAHTPLKEKLLKCGETNRGIGSVKKMAQEAAKRKAAEAAKETESDLEAQSDNS
jgi:hypothetical protein